MRNPVPDFTLVLTFMLPASFPLAVRINGRASARLHFCLYFHFITPQLAVRIDGPTSTRHYSCFDCHVMSPLKELAVRVHATTLTGLDSCLEFHCLLLTLD